MQTWKIVTIVLTSVSLIWNIANTFYTRNSNTRNTSRLVNLEEFRTRVRDPLEDVLRRSDVVLRGAIQLTRHPDFPEEFEDTLIEINQNLMSCMTEAQDCLMDADSSRFAAEIDWLDMYDPAEDEIMQQMNDFLDASNSKEERTEIVRRCKVSFRKFRKAVTAKIESQVMTLSA